MNETSMEPTVSVVIPSRRRAVRLAFALEALAEQTLALDRFEVVVVRDSPGDGLDLEPPPGLDVRFIDVGLSEGPALKRNLGWRSATAPLIVFTDDDCRPHPDWLGRLLEAWGGLGSSTEVLIQGRTDPDPDEAHLLMRLARSQSITGPSPWYQCCNLALPRRLLERIEGFHEEFAFGGEDTDLGLRAIATGARLVYADDVRVVHAVHPRGLVKAVKEALAWGSTPLLVARHPEVRRLLPRRFFWKQAHERLLLAAAGVAMARRTRGLSLLAIVPYLWLNWDRRVRPTPRRLAGYAPYAAERAAVDAAEVAATARAAVRYRTPLL